MQPVVDSLCNWIPVWWAVSLNWNSSHLILPFAAALLLLRKKQTDLCLSYLGDQYSNGYGTFQPSFFSWRLHQDKVSLEIHYLYWRVYVRVFLKLSEIQGFWFSKTQKNCIFFPFLTSGRAAALRVPSLAILLRLYLMPFCLWGKSECTLSSPTALWLLAPSLRSSLVAFRQWCHWYLSGCAMSWVTGTRCWSQCTTGQFSASRLSW